MSASQVCRDDCYWLDRAYNERHPGLIYLRTYPALEKLSSHPRVTRIVNTMKLPSPGNDAEKRRATLRR
jgi:hypothetical protein